jgi:hypothetical protein
MTTYSRVVFGDLISGFKPNIIAPVLIKPLSHLRSLNYDIAISQDTVVVYCAVELITMLGYYM